MYPLPGSLSIPAQVFTRAHTHKHTHTFFLFYPATPSTHFTYKDDKKLRNNLIVKTSSRIQTCFFLPRQTRNQTAIRFSNSQSVTS